MPRKAAKRRRVVGLLTDSDYVQLKSIAAEEDVTMVAMVRMALKSFMRQRAAALPIKDAVHDV